MAMERRVSEAPSVLVTGATGFVGSHLLDALTSTGAHIRALVRTPDKAAALAARGIEPVLGTLADIAALERAVAGVDVVVHMAAVTRARSADEYHGANAAGTRALIAAMRHADRSPRRLVYLSSLAAVGPAAHRPVTGDDTPRPLTAYGRSKLEGERICAEADGEFEIAVLRAPAVYGPRDRDMLTFFRMAARGIVPIPAGPERPVQLVHVTDLADALVRSAILPNAVGVYHIAEPQAYTWRQVAALIGEAVGRRVRTVNVPAWSVHAAAAFSEWADRLRNRASIFNRDKALELLAPGWLCETERAWLDLGFRAGIPLDRGLADTAQWYRAEGWL